MDHVLRLVSKGRTTSVETLADARCF